MPEVEAASVFFPRPAERPVDAGRCGLRRNRPSSDLSSRNLEEEALLEPPARLTERLEVVLLVVLLPLRAGLRLLFRLLREVVF